MLFLLLFILELISLFFLSRRVHQGVGGKLYKITGSRKLSVYLMSFLFLPGTFVHEMAHFLTALFLLVPVGNPEFVPKIEGDSIKLGSVSIAKVDFIRTFFISSAPLIIGTGIILLLTTLLSTGQIPGGFWSTVLVGYLVFTISNTMFISKKDFEGVWGFLILVASAAIIFILLGVNLKISFQEGSGLISILKSTDLFLIFPWILDIIALQLLR